MINEIENRDNWLNKLVTEIKLIEEKWKIDTLKRYRQCGTLILGSGYEKWKRNQSILTKFMELTNLGKTTIYYMVDLGKMSDKEFSDTIGEFPSLYAWSHPKSLGSAVTKPKQSISAMEKIMVPVSMFENEREAKNFFQAFDGVYEGLF